MRISFAFRTKKTSNFKDLSVFIRKTHWFQNFKDSPEAYSEPCRTNSKERVFFPKIGHGFLPLRLFWWKRVTAEAYQSVFTRFTVFTHQTWQLWLCLLPTLGITNLRIQSSTQFFTVVLKLKKNDMILQNQTSFMHLY